MKELQDIILYFFNEILDKIQCYMCNDYYRVTNFC